MATKTCFAVGACWRATSGADGVVRGVGASDARPSGKARADGCLSDRRESTPVLAQGSHLAAAGQSLRPASWERAIESHPLRYAPRRNFRICAGAGLE